MIQTQHLILDLNPGHMPIEKVTIKQGDVNSRIVRCVINDNGTDAKLDPATKVFYAIRKADHTQVYNSAKLTGNIVTFTLTDQCATASGRQKGELRFLLDDAWIASASFEIDVLPSTYDDSAPPSDDQYGILKEMIKNVSDADATSDQALQNANSALEKTTQFEQLLTDGQQMIERGNQMIASGTLVTRYGVSFGGSANTGATVTRLYDAARLVAGVGTDTVTATNDFDNIYPWSARRRCCGMFDKDGNFVVNAYKREPGYVEDGTNGEVWVEHSLFFYKHTYAEDAEEIVLSATQLAGFLPAPIFINPDGTLRQKAYTAAYPMATVDGKATSRSGVFSNIHSLDSAMASARTLGSRYTVTTTDEWYTECLYMWVEFATRNLQSVMMGASHMPYTTTDTATVAETGTNRIIVAAAVANKFVVGQTITIGTSLGGAQIVNNRIVTAISSYDANNKAILFDGEAATIAIGNVVRTVSWKNGSCNSVLSSSGSPTSNTDGRYNCVYRGKEAPYGNASECISDVLFKRNGAGTTENPYSYDIYYLSDPTKYSAGTITADYVKLNFQLPPNDGYVKKLGFDSRFPFLRIPCEVGASTSTYYSDSYEKPMNALTAPRVGGSSHYGPLAGPCLWSCYHLPSTSIAGYCARLSYHHP